MQKKWKIIKRDLNKQIKSQSGAGFGQAYSKLSNNFLQ